ncbi:M20/M25/M40 family metallo-hydrolase [Cnuibacter physcomitrellae]|uniref:M20/M25/M40 family metallo-hydrolase n=1 Tax=Cnuibacter physcomitrellae TaxID=1619308 RepID=UPI0021761901|nr:M20/M25/M40 family metallo-hydrolase [Cnuibacter physcomitrellae]MCS5496747.1 M20/M25/M40 family metallo-hydrolase [Cnuibacter physcomitrellae]
MTAPDDAVGRLRELLRIPTVSRPDLSDLDTDAFASFRSTVQALYPALHAAAERELVLEHTLLYRWPGAAEGPATVLMAHYDVVAAPDEGWTHPPFAAELVGDGARQELWGRGALDDKGSVAAILEGAEALAETGFVPAHDVYLLFGHDEETNGTGAREAARLLEARGVRIGLVLDEGGAVVDGVFPTVDRPLAVVGVSEKTTTMIELRVEQQGGHASTPPRETATSRLARAIVRMNAHPFPATLNPPIERMLRTIAPHARGIVRFVLSRPRLFRPLLLQLLTRIGVETSALLRTTAVATMLSAGHAQNALAESATAVVNARVAIDSDTARTVRRLKRVIADDGVTIRVLQAARPSAVSAMDGPGWDLVAETITAVYPDAVVVPYVQTGATDSRQFSHLSPTVYRFSPFHMTGEERAALHAKDERIHVRSYLTGIAFFERLIARL